MLLRWMQSYISNFFMIIFILFLVIIRIRDRENRESENDYVRVWPEFIKFLLYLPNSKPEIVVMKILKIGLGSPPIVVLCSYSYAWSYSSQLIFDIRICWFTCISSYFEGFILLFFCNHGLNGCCLMFNSDHWNKYYHLKENVH